MKSEICSAPYLIYNLFCNIYEIGIPLLLKQVNWSAYGHLMLVGPFAFETVADSAVVQYGIEFGCGFCFIVCFLRILIFVFLLLPSNVLAWL